MYLGVAVVQWLECDVVVNEFKLQSRYYIHFRTNAIKKGMSLYILHLWH